MVFDEEEKDKDEAAVSEDALAEVLDEDEDEEDAPPALEGEEEGKDWA